MVIDSVEVLPSGRRNSRGYTALAPVATRSESIRFSERTQLRRVSQSAKPIVDFAGFDAARSRRHINWPRGEGAWCVGVSRGSLR